ncbi:MAG: hypothetical protein ACI87O_001307 [Planctomycetota bacterium]|jgi:hypothetical protein
MLFNFLPLVLLAIAASPDKLIITKGPLPDGGSYEIQVRNEKDGTQRKHGYAKYFDAAGKLELSGRHAKGLRTGKWEAWHPKNKAPGYSAIYSHCIGTLALAEAFGSSGHPALLEPTQRAVTFLLKAKNSKGGWRYEMPSVGDTETSVTAWAYQALFSAHVAGIPIDDQVTEDVLEWVDSVTHAASGRVGYIGPAPGGVLLTSYRHQRSVPA